MYDINIYMIKISSLMQGLYIYYMFNFFKTTYSINHPFEMIFNNNYLKHPIKTGKYESKICPFGNHVGLFLLVWFIIRHHIKNNYYNNVIFLYLIIGSIIMNLNAFIYLIPVLLIEFRHMC